ncbi:MAG: alpha,alpha-trehalase [Alphaproteobacteria bacterium]|nr:alpha,alpha-trehalase [Alphaproteobacteria bacterium]
MAYRRTHIALLVAFVLLCWAASSTAQEAVQIEHLEGHPHGSDTVESRPDQAAVLRKCLFADTPAEPRRISAREFALACVVPYIHGLWLDPSVLYRSRANIAAQARDNLILHPKGEPFPIFYPPALAVRAKRMLDDALGRTDDVVLKPLPSPLPTPSLDSASLYNNIGLLYLPNPYVVPGENFNEMYGWDSFFIVKGLLASVDYVMRNPTARIWSPKEQSFRRLSTKPNDALYYRRFAERLFDTAKGMVDNHIFQIEYYGGFVLNANRTYYLTRSQPPLFTQEAIAVLESARRYGFDYDETLAPYLRLTRTKFVEPQNFEDWLRIEVLPAARTYFAYWTDPRRTRWGAGSNPRVVDVEHEGKTHHVYMYGTDGVGPPPEVARSTQPQNRDLYRESASYFKNDPAANPGRQFYNPNRVCDANQPVGNCGDPTYGLTQAYYAADRAVRASGFDLSGRFGKAGEWAMHYAPISLNVLLLRMAEDIDLLSRMVGETAPYGPEYRLARRQFLAGFFARGAGAGYADRFAVGDLPSHRPRLAYPYATQVYLLWGDVLASPAQIDALVQSLKAQKGGSSFLAPLTAPRFGIPTSLDDTGMQWDAPFAWAPIQYFAADGLLATDFPAEATVVMEQWVAAVNAFFAQTGLLIEKYNSKNPDNDPRARVGYAKTQRGFGWTNGVYMLFVNRLYQRF